MGYKDALHYNSDDLAGNDTTHDFNKHLKNDRNYKKGWIKGYSEAGETEQADANSLYASLADNNTDEDNDASTAGTGMLPTNADYTGNNDVDSEEEPADYDPDPGSLAYDKIHNPLDYELMKRNNDYDTYVPEKQSSHQDSFDRWLSDNNTESTADTSRALFGNNANVDSDYVGDNGDPAITG